MFNFKPKDDVFFNLFSEGAEITHLAAKELKALMSELESPKERLEKLTDLEHRGDKVTHQLIEHTKKMFITPLDREDIFSITKFIDDITDDIESTACRFYMYKVTTPTPEALQIVDKLVDATKELVVVISELKAHKNSKIMIDKIIDINQIENDADLIYRKAIRKLFDNPEDLLNTIKWKDLYKYLEDSIDACETLANEIRGVVMKYA